MSSGKDGSSSKRGAAPLLGLFEPPQPPPPNATMDDSTSSNRLDGSLSLRKTVRIDHTRPGRSERTALLQAFDDDGYQTTGGPDGEHASRPPFEETTPRSRRYRPKMREFCERHLRPTTFAGALMFLLYHVVFCLANGSAIIRPRGDRPILGVMAKMSALGILFAGPFYIFRLGQDIPALYPSIDLFLAPFLAGAAIKIDDALAEQEGGNKSDVVFFASFAVLAAVGMLLSGALLLAAASIKLANLGTFLPYTVLCGFFSAVGVLLWALAFSVDCTGKTWQTVFFSGDWELIRTSLLHHLPSLVVGILMNILGPKNPFYVILLILCTLVTFYTVMFVTGMTLEEAQEAEWFWSRHQLVYETDPTVGFTSWAPPAPFSIFKILFDGTVNWAAVWRGLGDMIALSILYLLRSSIHSSAMKKNVGNLVRKEFIHPSDEHTKGDEMTDGRSLGESLGDMSLRGGETSFVARFSTSVRLVSQALEGTGSSALHSPKRKQRFVPHQEENISKRVDVPAEVGGLTLAPNDETEKNGECGEVLPEIPKPERYGMRRVSEAVDLPVELKGLGQGANDENNHNRDYKEIRAKIPKRSLEAIFAEYGKGLLIVSFTGGFGVCPTVATSNTMYAIGADGPAPQYGSVLLLLFFYLTDFELVRFLPKACFSSLLVLGAVDTFVVWFFLAFKKTQDFLEWLVVPAIVTFSLIVGFLNAVFLGIGLAMFVFVANFFRVGVVKYNSSGLELHSTIERTPAAAEWLDEHGDLIQILVLQNYLFFGNANSILNYISTMFEEIDESESKRLGFTPPPFPKVIIIDLSLISGMDTSSYDVFAEIQETLKGHDCKLYLCGLSHRARTGLALVGVKPSAGLRSDRLVRFFQDLDSALGKAEDLLTAELDDYERGPILSVKGDSETGFLRALRQIDDQHGIHLAEGLIELQKHTVPVELKPGQELYRSGGMGDYQRGLFFIESGILKIQRDAGATLTLSRSNIFAPKGKGLSTLNRQHARTGSIGRRSSVFKASLRGLTQQHFRLARIGPGWLVGTIEISTGHRDPGVHIAVGHCRLHHLAFHKVQHIEQETPELATRLYKLISHLMAHRQETTIAQLAALKSIISSPAQTQ